jgi:uncharacterized protein (UPF0332 family)
MSSHAEDYIITRLKEARESIEEARVLLNHQMLRGAINRMYYACFYGVEGLLWTKRLRFSKHSGVLSTFQQHWVHAGKLPPEMGKFYAQLFDWRLKGDYKEAQFSQEQVESWYTAATEFLETIAVQITDFLEGRGESGQ